MRATVTRPSKLSKHYFSLMYGRLLLVSVITLVNRGVVYFLQVWSVVSLYLDTQYVNSSEFASSGLDGEYKPRYYMASDAKQWISQWMLFLIEHVPRESVRSPVNIPMRCWSISGMFVQAPVWFACITVVRNDIPSAMFLLPYLVQDCLAVGNARLSNAIFSEILSVLNDTGPGLLLDSPASAAPSQAGPKRGDSAVGTRAGLRQAATQAVFSLLDALESLGPAASPHVKQLLNSIPQVCPVTLPVTHSV